jgi:hypothetical protein
MTRPSSASARPKLEGFGPRCRDRRMAEGGDGAGLQGCGETANLVPLAGDERGVDAVASQALERPVVGRRVESATG